MTGVAAAARARGITEVLHYTSEKGVMGSIIMDALLSRRAVEESEEVAYIYEGVWDRSRDIDWVGHISMSITAVNTDLFSRSRTNHPHWWWAVMSFDPEILDDAGVVFTTTNNAYQSTCLRGEGAEGLSGMFADEVLWGHFNTVARRSGSTPRNMPTHNAAEVLYPRAISMSRLRALYLPDDRHASLIRGWTEIYARPPVPIVIRPELF